MDGVVKYTAPVVPDAEQVESLTQGVFTIKDGRLVAEDPAVQSWMEGMRS
jgi:patatin-like phospholipase/acyl hydrolase